MQLAFLTPLLAYILKKEMFVSLHKLIKFSTLFLLQREVKACCLLGNNFYTWYTLDFIFLINRKKI
jgi:hypothetical protein